MKVSKAETAVVHVPFKKEMRRRKVKIFLIYVFLKGF